MNKDTPTLSQDVFPTEIRSIEPKNFLWSKTIWGIFLAVIPLFLKEWEVDLTQVEIGGQPLHLILGSVLTALGLRTASQPLGLPNFLGKNKGVVGLLLIGTLCGLATLALSSCGSPVTVTPDGCLKKTVERNGMVYESKVCFAGDGSGEIDRMVITWEDTDGRVFEATQFRDERGQVIRYRDGEDSGWLEWSSKSGLMIGPVPPEVEEGVNVERRTSKIEFRNFEGTFAGTGPGNHVMSTKVGRCIPDITKNEVNEGAAGPLLPVMDARNPGKA